ncbi:MAG: amidohydrolase [Bacteroidia bacterium]|nr:amidohydrolase [Bacteroidia bacterium]NNF30403.1 amidohydrolase [Flavobacteriaceae bacterium]MBT8275703.1 amidohydrolase [Bacteroidia bacterium]NNJ82319.1 amidohydrolase [Flavobacteriaceae bacterium]NNK54710.1 amidohydrolase [Flavobacteriaceae bacterium]
MNELSVGIIQSNLHWENPEANRDMLEAKISSFEPDTNLVVLPEMFTTGFSMNALELAEKKEGTTLEWMRSIASNQDIAVTGSLIVREKRKFYNRLYFVFPDGSYHWYDKKHTFTLAGEHRTYAAGKEKLIIDFHGWKICPLICYDLRFPVWSRNTEDYDLLIYVANWPKKRISAWDALLRARAIENMSYCIGVNRIGVDGNNHEYIGHSAVYNVLGDLISNSDNEIEFTEKVVLSKDHILNTRKQLQFLNDRDAFSLI